MDINLWRAEMGGRAKLGGREGYKGEGRERGRGDSMVMKQVEFTFPAYQMLAYHLQLTPLGKLSLNPNSVG